MKRQVILSARGVRPISAVSQSHPGVREVPGAPAVPAAQAFPEEADLRAAEAVEVEEAGGKTIKPTAVGAESDSAPTAIMKNAYCT